MVANRTNFSEGGVECYSQWVASDLMIAFVVQSQEAGTSEFPTGAIRDHYAINIILIHNMFRNIRCATIC